MLEALKVEVEELLVVLAIVVDVVSTIASVADAVATVLVGLVVLALGGGAVNTVPTGTMLVM